ncbi:YihY/virulence factor BrkB family protein [Marinilactibacillus piezotolerans]|uniref:YihY/virulence factor BrkB family protein n=1 Tax=Marinilactibacillus piezotolerans TaxID=258723 RepID=UPI0009B0FEBB|nr:YihY/virulence factor BrkB family protein [Marinilactibacillus piezotolerans]
MEKLEKYEDKIPQKNKLARLIRILQSNWERAEVSQSAAEMAYFLLLSLLPVLLVIANIIPLLPMATADVLNFISDIIPNDIYDVLRPTIESYLQSGSGGAISFGLLAAIWSSSRVINILRTVLNDVYGAVQQNNFIVARILSVLVMMGILLVIGLAVFIFVFGEQILNIVQQFVGFSIPYIEEFLVLRYVVLIGILFVVFLIVYRFVPNHSLTMKYSYPGAIFTTVGWLILVQGFSLYLNLAGGDAVANATFGAFIALMLFLYLSSIIILLGALLNTIIFEWNTHESVPEYESELRRQNQINDSSWTGYPDEADVTVLKRRLYKVNRLKEDEIKERKEEQQNN